MADIRHRVGIQAPAERVYEALTTTEGVASWWWQDARGDARGNGRLAIDASADETAVTRQQPGLSDR